MTIQKTKIEGVLEIQPKIHSDERGWFHRVFDKSSLQEVITKPIVQINHSFNKVRGTFRGFHFQKAPYAESKLIRCIQGKVYDMALDLRKESETFLQVVAVELCAEKRNMIFIPEGCAHGFITLEDNCELEYYHSEEYQRDFESGFSIFDERLEVHLPIEINVISERDKSFEPLGLNFEGI